MCACVNIIPTVLRFQPQQQIYTTPGGATFITPAFQVAPAGAFVQATPNNVQASQSAVYTTTNPQYLGEGGQFTGYHHHHHQPPPQLYVAASYGHGAGQQLMNQTVVVVPQQVR